MNKKTIILLGFILTAIIASYIINFCDRPISTDTETWGAFADYMNLSVSILSIYLIYVTYKEQSNSNKIGRFEERYKTFVHIFIDLVNKERSLINETYTRLCKHFDGVMPDDDPVGTAEENSKILTYYYSNILLSAKTESLNECFKYLNFFIGNLHCSKDISTEEKKARLLELSSVVPENVRILFFCWKLCENDCSLLDYCYKCHFLDLTSKDCILTKIIHIVCTSNFINNKSNKIDGENIMIDVDDTYKKEETYGDTFDRLFNNKTQQQ